MDNLNKYNPAHHPQRYPLGRNPHSAKDLERKRKHTQGVYWEWISRSKILVMHKT